jgi:hypothetical protein
MTTHENTMQNAYNFFVLHIAKQMTPQVSFGYRCSVYGPDFFAEETLTGITSIHARTVFILQLQQDTEVADSLF